jgi:hypothetical protein
LVLLDMDPLTAALQQNPAALQAAREVAERAAHEARERRMTEAKDLQRQCRHRAVTPAGPSLARAAAVAWLRETATAERARAAELRAAAAAAEAAARAEAARLAPVEARDKAHHMARIAAANDMRLCSFALSCAHLPSSAGAAGAAAVLAAPVVARLHRRVPGTATGLSPALQQTSAAAPGPHPEFGAPVTLRLPMALPRSALAAAQEKQQQLLAQQQQDAGTNTAATEDESKALVPSNPPLPTVTAAAAAASAAAAVTADPDARAVQAAAHRFLDAELATQYVFTLSRPPTADAPFSLADVLAVAELTAADLVAAARTGSLVARLAPSAAAAATLSRRAQLVVRVLTVAPAPAEGSAPELASDALTAAAAAAAADHLAGAAAADARAADSDAQMAAVLSGAAPPPPVPAAAAAQSPAAALVLDALAAVQRRAAGAAAAVAVADAAVAALEAEHAAALAPGRGPAPLVRDKGLAQLGPQERAQVLAFEAATLPLCRELAAAGECSVVDADAPREVVFERLVAALQVKMPDIEALSLSQRSSLAAALDAAAAAAGAAAAAASSSSSLLSAATLIPGAPGVRKQRPPLRLAFLLGPAGCGKRSLIAGLLRRYPSSLVHLDAAKLIADERAATLETGAGGDEEPGDQAAVRIILRQAAAFAGMGKHSFVVTGFPESSLGWGWGYLMQEPTVVRAGPAGEAAAAATAAAGGPRGLRFEVASVVTLACPQNTCLQRMLKAGVPLRAAQAAAKQYDVMQKPIVARLAQEEPLLTMAISTNAPLETVLNAVAAHISQVLVLAEETA